MKMEPPFEKTVWKIWPTLFCGDNKANVTACGYMMVIKVAILSKHELILLYAESISCFWKLHNLIQCFYWHFLQIVKYLFS